MIILKTDWKSIDREIDRLERSPSVASQYLDIVLHQGFAASQAMVHVITGSLKSSGKANTDFDGKTWKGEISYGGVSLGVNNPVTYAIYEKARDGGHDFMTPLKSLDTLFTKAMLKALGGK